CARPHQNRAGCRLQDRSLGQRRGSNHMHTFAREFLPQRKLHSSQEPEVAMFRGLRVRLTLWYSSVLAVALVLFGVALYFGVQYLLFSPFEVDLATHAHSHMR